MLGRLIQQGMHLLRGTGCCIRDPTIGAIDTGAVSVANGVMYAGSYSRQMYALDANTGTIFWNFASGGSVIDGPSIVDGVVYWGSGYKIGIGNNKVYAFTVAGSTIEAATGTVK